MSANQKISGEYARADDREMVKHHVLYPQESEAATLGTAMNSPDLADSIDPDTYCTEKNRLIARAIVEIRGEGMVPDISSVADRLAASDKLFFCGGITRLAELDTLLNGSWGFHQHLKLVKTAAARRNFSKALERAKQQATDGSVRLPELLTEVEEASAKAAQASSTSSLVHVSGAAEQAVEEMKTRSTEGGSIGTPTGFPGIDGILSGGGLRPCLVIVASRPGVGKSTVAGQILLNIARLGKDSLLYTMEMGRSEIAFRLISSISSVPHDRLQLGDMVDREWDAVEKAVEDLSSVPMFIDDTRSQTVESICASAREHIRSHPETGCIVIDYLGLMDHDDNKRVSELGRITRKFKVFTGETGVPVIMVCQLSRKNVDEKRDPEISDLRDSGNIEQDADIVIFAVREGENARILVKKQRGGMTGECAMNFDGATYTFSSIDRETRDFSNF